jgi:hypothetical protein
LTSPDRAECVAYLLSHALRCDDLHMDGAMMGIAGAVVGASAMGMAGVARSAADTFLPRMVEDKNHKNQIKMQLHAQRHEAVQRWRSGLAEARDTYRQWACGPRF